MNVGTLPATLVAGGIAEVLFANGALSWKVSTPFDFRLVGFHLCIATVFWYAVGRWLEIGRTRWRRLALSYTAVRLPTVPASLILRGSDWWMLCSLLLMLAWIFLAVIVLWKGVRQIWIRHQAESASAR
jgi:hypothetical protein